MATMTMDFGSARFAAPAATPVRLTARGRRVVTALVVLLATVAAFALLSLGKGAVVSALTQAPASVAVDHSVVVRPGDTLWSIAARELPGSDPREAIGRIRTLNAMSPADVLIAGQELAVPAA